ncbi:MAG TPA: DUF2752 domain-containing protein [Ignavibacteriaceae bacterium]|nr:DUF2752 domain-containing protein [Ignavibacteriaceae bacterium]
MKSYFKKIFSLVSPEALIWTSGLMILAFIKTDSTSHFTICPLKIIGLDFCPGCGLGKSIHYLLHLELEQSFNAHPLGIFALGVLFHRIYELTGDSFKHIKIYLSTKREKIYDQSFTINAQP